MNHSPNMIVVDGCAVPVDIYSTTRAAAIQSGRTQFIGVLYKAPRPARPSWHLFADLRAGYCCEYITGLTRDELRTKPCAMILWIGPHCEEVNHA